MTDICVFKFSAATLINLGEIPKMSLDFFELRLCSIFNTSTGSSSFKINCVHWDIPGNPETCLFFLVF